MTTIDRLRSSTLTAWALITLLLALLMSSPYLPHTVLHAQQTGPGGVPGAGGGAGAVSSVFGRSGAVVAASGDYTAAQVTNAAATNAANTFTASQTIATPEAELNLGDTSTGKTQEIITNNGFDYMSNSASGLDWVAYNAEWFALPNTSGLSWLPNNYFANSPDTGISRISAGVVGVGTGAPGNAAGTVEAAKLTLGGVPITQAATQPTGACAAVAWVLSNDGHFSYCSGSGGTWANNSAGTVASATVSGQSSSVSLFTIYTPPAQGLYEVCAGEVVTSAGSTGATIEAIVTYANPGFAGANTGLGATVAATTAGADSSATRVNTSCQTFLLSASAVQLQYVVGGAPATNPTYTYWYTVTKKN